MHRRDIMAADGHTRPLLRVEITRAVRRKYSEVARQAAPCSTTRTIELYRGFSSEIALPAGIDLIVHEILGNIASAEGAIHAINDLHARHGLASRSCRVLPLAAGTLLTPTMMLEPCVLERLLLFERSGCLAAKPRALYATRGFPSERFLAEPQPFEWLDFNRPHLPHVSTRTCTFVTHREGFFDGLHMHLVVNVDEATSIDVYRERTTWTCSYVRLLGASEAVWLAAGSTIQCVCEVDASTQKPVYQVQVHVACGQEPMRHIADFSWRGDG
mmetsp:Transcript_40839/g.112278  ORF Transcript_40839/g.112278 Transcript_40839/m.112278 type:complete len:272 (+) Transcript_40839:168-983(+)